MIPQGAEVVGTYQADFYAGTPAVTRNAFGAGHGWYVAAGLDQAGRLLGRAAGAGPARPGRPLRRTCPTWRPPCASRRTATRLLFLLNHGAEPVRAVAHTGGVDLLSGDRVERGEPITLDPNGVMVLRENG